MATRQETHYICDRCGKENYSPLRVINSVSDRYELCDKCMRDFSVWMNSFKKSDKAMKMVYNGYSAHDTESHYKCPICGRDYGSYQLMGIDELTCECGQLLKA